MSTTKGALGSRKQRAIKRADEICTRMTRFGIERTNVATSTRVDINEHLQMPRVANLLRDRDLKVYCRTVRDVSYYTIEA